MMIVINVRVAVRFCVVLMFMSVRMPEIGNISVFMVMFVMLVVQMQMRMFH